MEEVFEFAKQLQADGQHEKAEQCYRRYLEDHSDSFKALNNLGTVLQSQNKLGEAIKCFREATELVPEDAIPRFNLGNAYYYQERYESAAAQYNQLLESNSNHGPARLNLAIIHWRQGNLELAEVHLRKALLQEDVATKANSQLGLLLFDANKVEEARECHLQAAKAEPSPEHFFHAALCDEVLQNHDNAAAMFAQALELDPGSRITHEHRVRALMSANDQEGLEIAFDAWTSALPGDPICTHMLAAYRGDDSVTRCSEEFVRDTFSAFAADFNETLTRLEYGAPDAIGNLVNQRVNQEKKLSCILDAGCGTGLCGALLRKHAVKLVGVDLAAPMLDKARKLALYDNLEEADLVTYLTQHPATFDLIVASDTFNYFGALDELFAACAQALHGPGQLMFTLELNTAGDKGYQLMRHGRFQHQRKYIEQSLENSGFANLNFDTFVLRRESGQNVNGWLIEATRV